MFVFDEKTADWKIIIILFQCFVCRHDIESHQRYGTCSLPSNLCATSLGYRLQHSARQTPSTLNRRHFVKDRSLLSSSSSCLVSMSLSVSFWNKFFDRKTCFRHPSTRPNRLAIVSFARFTLSFIPSSEITVSSKWLFVACPYRETVVIALNSNLQLTREKSHEIENFRFRKRACQPSYLWVSSLFFRKLEIE